MGGGRSGARDWVSWHDDYSDPTTGLSRRLGVVRRMLGDILDRAEPGPLRLASACAGQGDDVLGVLGGHPRGGDVRALLLETDPDNAEVARGRARALGLDGVEVATADAGLAGSYRGVVPAHVLLFCGVFGNVHAADIARTVQALGSLGAPGAWVVWTRGRRPGDDLTPTIRRWFAKAGFREHEFVAPVDDAYSVGCHRLMADPAPFDPDAELFRFG